MTVTWGEGGGYFEGACDGHMGGRGGSDDMTVKWISVARALTNSQIFLVEDDKRCPLRFQQGWRRRINPTSSGDHSVIYVQVTIYFFKEEILGQTVVEKTCIQ